MKTRNRLALCLLCALLVAPWAQAVNVGDQAPPVNITTWIKYPQPQVFDGTKVCVIEMWATWCPYCVQAIPEMTRLQALYKNTVRVVGVSNESPSVLTPFVAARVNTMDYAVGCDDGTIFDDYGVGGIPHSYVVDQSGRIAWHGHPTQLAGPLAQAVADGIFFKQGLAQGFPNEGENFTFSVEMANDNPVTYSWTHNGVPVGGDSPTLTLSNVTLADAGTYVCTASKVGQPGITQRSQRYLVVVPAGEGMPVDSPWTVAALVGLVSLAGAVLTRHAGAFTRGPKS